MENYNQEYHDAYINLMDKYKNAQTLNALNTLNRKHAEAVARLQAKQSRKNAYNKNTAKIIKNYQNSVTKRLQKQRDKVQSKIEEATRFHHALQPIREGIADSDSFTILMPFVVKLIKAIDDRDNILSIIKKKPHPINEEQFQRDNAELDSIIENLLEKYMEIVEEFTESIDGFATTEDLAEGGKEYTAGLTMASWFLQKNLITKEQWNLPTKAPNDSATLKDLFDEMKEAIEIRKKDINAYEGKKARKESASKRAEEYLQRLEAEPTCLARVKELSSTMTGENIATFNRNGKLNYVFLKHNCAEIFSGKSRKELLNDYIQRKIALQRGINSDSDDNMTDTVGFVLGSGGEGKVVILYELFDKGCRQCMVILKIREFKPKKKADNTFILNTNKSEQETLKYLSKKKHFQANNVDIYPYSIYDYVPKLFYATGKDEYTTVTKGTAPTEDDRTYQYLFMKYTPFIPTRSIKKDGVMRKMGLTDRDDKKLAKSSFTFDELRKLTISPWHAIDALHMAEYIHNDIKPANLLFTVKSETEDTENPIINGFKLIDFGYAERGTKNSEQGTVTKDIRGWKGTPDYYHPELKAGKKRYEDEKKRTGALTQITFKSSWDNYALSKSLYEIYCNLNNEKASKICLDMLCYMSNNIWGWHKSLLDSNKEFEAEKAKEPKHTFIEDKVLADKKEKEDIAMLKWLCKKYGFTEAGLDLSDIPDLNSKLPKGCPDCETRKGGSRVQVSRRNQTRKHRKA